MPKYDWYRYQKITEGKKVKGWNSAAKFAFNLILSSRFSDVGLKNVYLLFYFPFGLLLLTLRFLLGVIIWILGNVLPDVSLTRTILSSFLRVFFGIVVRVDKTYNKKNVKVIISNQISPMDHLVVHTATDCVLVSNTFIIS